MSKEAANNLVKEFCLSIGMSALGFDEDNQRSLSFDDKIIVSFIGEDNDMLTAICYIGDLKKDADMRMFLEQNFMPDAHGGARFSLEPKSSRVVLTNSWNATRIDLSTFSKSLEGFVNSGMRAQEFLDKGGLSTGAAPVSEAPAAPEGQKVQEEQKPTAVVSSLDAYRNML